MEIKPNRLLAEKSPYLLQHAYNPVDWYPWGPEVFEKARHEDKPIFLSVGYSTCHWCHVMAHESFEDLQIAEILNSWFISVKVDREERPDIDQMYMAATQMMSGGGGWPMSVFLLPDGSPFYAGTYFPPHSSYQRPGFKDLLTALNKAWRQNRDEIQQVAAQIVSHLSVHKKDERSLQADTAERCFKLLAESFDSEEGGFSEAPKFPRPAVFAFLFDWYHRTGSESAREMALFTLDKMAAGGMHDHIGGGFHRYSVDTSWFVSHFEKMLYDQSQLAHSYLDAYLLSNNTDYAWVAGRIFDYLLRDMRGPMGGFFSAEDADSADPYAPGEHGEGAFYLWTYDEIIRLLGGNSGELFCYVYGVEKDGNVRQDPTGEFVSRNILSLVHDTGDAAQRFGLLENEVRSCLSDARELLLQTRGRRTRPHCDDKIITGWNGPMIGALARGSRILENPDLLTYAIQTAVFIHDNLYDEKTGNLFRRYREKEAGLTAQLDDYVSLVSGLLDLYGMSHDPRWLRWAETLTRQQIHLFWNEEGGYFYDSAFDSTLKVRMRGTYDGAEPAGNSIAAHNLLYLACLRDRDEWRLLAGRLIASFAEVMDRYPPALPLMVTAWQHLEGCQERIIIVGERGTPDTEALLRVIDRSYHPHRIVLLADGGENQRYLSEKLPFINSIDRPRSGACAHVCTDFSCKHPIQDPQELAHQLGVVGK